MPPAAPAKLDILWLLEHARRRVCTGMHGYARVDTSRGTYRESRIAFTLLVERTLTQACTTQPCKPSGTQHEAPAHDVVSEHTSRAHPCGTCCLREKARGRARCHLPTRRLCYLVRRPHGGWHWLRHTRRSTSCGRGSIRTMRRSRRDGCTRDGGRRARRRRVCHRGSNGGRRSNCGGAADLSGR